MTFERELDKDEKVLGEIHIRITDKTIEQVSGDLSFQDVLMWLDATKHLMLTSFLDEKS